MATAVDEQIKEDQKQQKHVEHALAWPQQSSLLQPWLIQPTVPIPSNRDETHLDVPYHASTGGFTEFKIV